jgi:hypothetical protein
MALLDTICTIIKLFCNLFLYSGHQNKNGLIERARQTMTYMARAFIADMQMPRSYWYWGLRQSVQYIPVTVEVSP